MKAVDKAKRLASHICIICSTAILVIQILDWYNPFMDFMGNSRFLLYGLCIAAMFLGICEICRKKDDKGRRRKYAGSKHESIFSKERYGIFPGLPQTHGNDPKGIEGEGGGVHGRKR